MMLKDYISKNHIGTLYEYHELKQYTTFKIGGICRYYIEVSSIVKLSLLIKYLKKINYLYYILGNGSNLLIDDCFLDCVFISLKKLNKITKLAENIYMLDAGLKPNLLGIKLVKDGFIDAIPFCLIPGTIGGLTYMNASCFKKSIQNIVKSVICMDHFGNIIFLKDCQFSYRKSIFQELNLIILKVIFEFKEKKEDAYSTLKKYQNIKKTTQPMLVNTSGSMFMNDLNYHAWELIDKLKLRGFSINDACISMIHTNFFLNKGNAKFKEMIALIYYVKTKIFLEFNIKLKLEVKIITIQSIAYSKNNLRNKIDWEGNYESF